jgi:hypothetical protein
MTKEQANQALAGIAIIGAIVLFALGRVEAGAAVLAFLGGHVLPSPMPARPEGDQ